MMWEKRLREGFVQPGEDRALRVLLLSATAFWEGAEKSRTRFFSDMHGARTRGNEHKLQYRKC